MMGKMGRKGIKREGLWRKWGGEAIRLVQGGDEKPLIGKDTPVQLRSISYKGLLSPSGASGLSSKIMIAGVVE